MLNGFHLFDDFARTFEIYGADLNRERTLANNNMQTDAEILKTQKELVELKANKKNVLPFRNFVKFTRIIEVCIMEYPERFSFYQKLKIVEYFIRCRIDPLLSDVTHAVHSKLLSIINITFSYHALLSNTEDNKVNENTK